MDEPMSALDIGKQVDLLKVLHDLSKEEKTIILTTHKHISLQTGFQERVSRQD